jgi:hypothetical protein
VFKPLIITVLEQAGGELEADELFLQLEILAEDRLLPEDSATTPEGAAGHAPGRAGGSHR